MAAQIQLANIQTLLLLLAQTTSTEALLSLAVETLASFSSVALARVWLLEEGDLCPHCEYSKTCTDHTRCLHLKASAGKSRDGSMQWTETTGEYSRFSLGTGKVGRIANEGCALEDTHLGPQTAWLKDRDWAAREDIKSFAGQPLVCRGEVLGVLALFIRERLGSGTLNLLRMVADHLAYAIANAKSFELVERLRERIETENTYLREEVKSSHTGMRLIGQSAKILHIREQVAQVADTDANVFLYGESGTGKEMVAHALHERSRRRDKPMVKINCSAVPPQLFESEFFGHVKGAFTGALKDRAGYFQTADCGTLFLDEVGEIPLPLQSKLLRVLQEGEYQRVGDSQPRKVNVRIISATNKNLQLAVQAGTFRRDLYYRLHVFPIHLPDLQERKEDIPLLARHFMLQIGKRINRPPVPLSAGHMETLAAYDWPGNIRELQNIIERVLITGQATKVLQELRSSAGVEPGPHPLEQRSIPGILTEAELQRLERANLQKALTLTNKKIYGPKGAAALLGMKPTTLLSRVKKFGF